MRSEEIRSEHGGRSTEIHGCYRRLLLVLTAMADMFIQYLSFVVILFSARWMYHAVFSGGGQVHARVPIHAHP